MSISVTSASPTGGPTSPWRCCRCRGTTQARWEDELLDAYGVEPDPTRIDYYQRLWQAGDIVLPLSSTRHRHRAEGTSVQVTSVGHAGFRIDTKAGSILCDPWVNPAYFASWFPFPDNSALDWDALGDVRLPLRLPPAHRPLRPEEPARARQQGRRRAAARLPGARPAARTGEAGLPPVLRDHRLGQTPRQRPQGRPRRDDHRAARPGRRPDRRLRPGGRRRRDRRAST